MNHIPDLHLVVPSQEPAPPQALSQNITDTESAPIIASSVNSSPSSHACSSSSSSYTVALEGGHPWGVRLQGGFEYAQHVRIAQVKPGSSAYKQGVRVGDRVDSINGCSTDGLEHSQALQLLHSNNKLLLQLTRETREISIPIICVNSPETSGGGGGVDVTSQDGSLQGDLSIPRDIVKMTSTVSHTFNHQGGYCVQRSEGVQWMNQGHTDEQETVSAIVWSPNGRRKQKVYQPVRFDATKPSSTSGEFHRSKAGEVVLSSFGTSPTDLRIPISTGVGFSYGKHPRKASDPVMRPNNGYVSKSVVSQELSRPSNRPNRRERSCYVSDPGFSRKEQEQDNSLEKPSPEDEPRSPPPVFHNITDFEKRYGPCLPVNLSTNRNRFKNRPSDSSCTSPVRQSTHVSLDQPLPLAAGAPVVTLKNRLNASPTRSKGLAMFFSQRDKHVDDADDNCLPLEEGSLYADLIDHKIIEKRLFPADLLKCPKIQEVPETLPVPTVPAEVVKSSAVIHLLDSEESDMEQIENKQKTSRRIAVKSVGKSSGSLTQNESAYSSQVSTDDDEGCKQMVAKRPVTTSQNFLKNLLQGSTKAQDTKKKKVPTATLR